MLALAVASSFLIGHSVEHRPIKAIRSGDGPRRVLVVGSIHGDEPGGMAVVRGLRARRTPAGITLWTVRTANPDGAAHHTRWNARGVDLNRNWNAKWAPVPHGRYYSGPRAFSEPESRAMSRFIARIQPDLTVWIHQPYGIVVDSPTASRAALRGYAKRVGLPLTSLGFLSGTAIRWQRAHRPGSDNLVVELAGVGPVSAATVSRHVAAIFGVAKAGAARAAAARKPTIVQSPIPFGADRRRQMRAYARRHYGLGSELLTDPKVIVEHFTASSTYSSAFNTFAGNAPDPELHELPGVCAHFVVDRDGTIHQLVALRFMCRHTIGLNDSAIGIEHVGLSDAQVMGDRRQLAASLRLTRWLMGEYGIERKNVIGHAESLSSPYHHERVKALRTRTHGDMARPAMRRYRKLLEAGPQ